MKCSRLKCPNVVDPKRLKYRLCRKHWAITPVPSHRVDSTPCRHHLVQLLALQWTYGAIARRSGVARTAVREALGRSRIQAATEAAILAVPLTRHLSGKVVVDATGTRRRVEALAYLGWPLSHLEPRFTRCRGRVGKAIATGWVSTVVADDVERVYRDLENTPGPSDIARRRALRLGFAGPAAWDGRDIDDPRSRPLAPYRLGRRVA